MAQELSTYLSYGKSQVSRFKNHAFADLVRPPSLLLEVNKGVQLGSMSVMEMETFTVGDTFDDDVFIVDGGGAVSLTTKRTAIGTLVTLTSQRADVVADGKPVTATPITVRVPFELKVAQTSVSVTNATDIVDQQPARPQMAIFQAAAVFIAIALIMGLFWVGSSNVSPRVMTVAAPSSPVEGPAPEPLDAATVILENTAMIDRVTVEERGNSTYELVGNVSQRDRKAWTDVRQNLDQVFDGYNLLNRVSVTPALVDVPAVSMVFRKPEPFLLLMDGRQVPLGAELTDGWILESIDEAHFIVTKNADRTTLAY